MGNVIMETSDSKIKNSRYANQLTNAGKGRPKGATNKSTGIVRDAIATLLERNVPNMERWLTRVAEGDEVLGLRPDPAKALDLMQKLSEYHIPKLARTEISGPEGGAIPVASLNLKGLSDAEIDQMNALMLKAANGGD